MKDLLRGVLQCQLVSERTKVKDDKDEVEKSRTSEILPPSLFLHNTKMDEWQAATAREINGIPRRPNVLIGVTGSVASIKLAKLVELLNARQVAGSIPSV